jgi:hypothetical protein
MCQSLHTRCAEVIRVRISTCPKMISSSSGIEAKRRAGGEDMMDMANLASGYCFVDSARRCIEISWGHNKKNQDGRTKGLKEGAVWV